MKNNTPLPVASFLNQFNDAEKSFTTSLLPMKKDAIARFEELGFPTTKNEDWKYTNVFPILNNTYHTAANEFNVKSTDILKFISGWENDTVLVFENGKYNAALSKLQNLPSGVIAGDIKDFSDHPSVNLYLGKIASYTNESFVALNTALFNRGAFIYVPKNVQINCNIHVLFLNDSRANSTVCHPRNLYVAEKGSKVKISENYYSLDSVNPAFCNPVTEINIEENASLELCKNQSENENDFHIDYTAIHLQKNANLNINTITTGGKIVRNNLRIVLQGRNASAYLNGLYVVSGECHVDNHSFVDHSSPDCYSNELYKGILDDHSHGVFNGRIYVRKDAQKTNAYQSNKNILLSDDATMYAKPQLEIYADDVKCSHGATTGQLDPESMFYLRSRGIGERESRALLTMAYAEEVLDKITILPVKEKLQEVVHSRLMKESN